MRHSKHGFERFVKRSFVDQALGFGENSTMALRSKNISPADQALADNLRAGRSRAGLTLDEAAARFGLSNQAINQWEMAKTKPGRDRIKQIMQVYNMSYNDIFGHIELAAESDELVGPVHLFGRPEEVPIRAHFDYLETNVNPEFDGLKIEGEVAAGRWIEMHADIEGEHAYHDIYDRVPVALDYRWPREAQYGLIVRGTSINNVAIDGDVLTCVSIHETGYRPREHDLVIVEQRRDAGLLVERTAKRWLELPEQYELSPDSSDPRWQSPLVIPKKVGFDQENEDGILVTLKAFVTWVHRPLQVPVRRRR